MKRTLLRIGAAVLGVLTLSGCLKIDMDMKVRNDEKMDGTVIFAFSAELLKTLGQTKKQFIDSMKTASSSVPKGSKTELYDKDGWIGQKVTFTNVPVSDFSRATGATAGAAAATGSKASADDFKLVKDHGKWQFNGTMDFTSTTGTKTTTAPDLSKLGDSLKPEIRIKLTFPGRIIKHDKFASVSGNSVTWKPEFGKKTVMAVTAEAG